MGDALGPRDSDPDAPKKPLGAYKIFVSEKMPQVKLENPGIKHNKTFGIISALWKELSADEKGPFEEKAVLAKVEYEVALVAYKEKKAADRAGAAVEAL